MPEAITEQSTQQPETFTSYRGNRGGAAPAPVLEPKVDSPVDGAAAEGGDPSPDSSPSAETAPESVPGLKQGKADRRKAEIQAEIDRLTWRKAEVRREVEAIEQQLHERQNGKQPAAQPVPRETYDGTDPNDPAPKEADFAQGANGYQDWLDARSAWIGRREARKLMAQERERSQIAERQKAHTEALTTFEQRGQVFTSEHEDFPELVDQFKKTQVSPETAAIIVEEELGPAALYHLMTHPDELKRIESLPNAMKRISAMYKLMKSLEGEPAPTPAPVPAPATPQPSKAQPAKPRVTGETAPGEPKTFSAYRDRKFAAR